METLFTSVFWICVGLTLYAYIGYPVLVLLKSKLFPRGVDRSPIEPDVTVIITAYNEERALRAKIENTLQLEYPKEKLQVIVASDGSTDRTDEIARTYESSGVELFRQEGRKGKTFTQNRAVERAKGEIILFSDATTMYPADVLKALLPNFNDPTVGCAAGKLIYVDPAGSDLGNGAKSYWSYESLLKRSESQACSLIGASGCLYAVRKSAYVPMYPEACSDFLICTVLYRQGLRSVYEPTAICTEETNNQSDKEFQMRVRVISQTFTDLWRNRDMLNPFKSGFYAVELISHKLLRYMVPFFLLLILASSVMMSIDSRFFAAVASLQVIFYIAAFSAWVLESKKIQLGVFAMPLYFVLANLSSVMGLYKFLRGENFSRWEPIR